MVLALAGKCCICPAPWGAVNCEDELTGIEEVYYTCAANIVNIAYSADTNNCDSNAKIDSFGLQLSTPTPNAAELLQPVNFVQQDDDTGAELTAEYASQGGNKTYTPNFVLQVVGNNVDQEASIFSVIGRQVAFIIKYKNKRWRALNQKGGAKVTLVSEGSNLAYYTITLTGRLNERPLEIDATWAATALIPNSVDPVNGLINA